jgi:acyl-coenzyme A synthetase/AMP-(fatty) acid ligase
MSIFPFLGPYAPHAILALQNESQITRDMFLSHITELSNQLPNRAFVLNFCEDRYWFLVGFAAALMRNQITLLPPTRTPEVLTQIGHMYRQCYCLVDEVNHGTTLDTYDVRHCQGARRDSYEIPRFPENQVAAIAFTSGSTGEPQPHKKTWGSLVTIAQKTGARLGINGSEEMGIVATVPPQHMFGLETSIILAIQHGATIHSGRPFYPEDVRLALSVLAGQRILITTPLHIRACVTEGTSLPPLICILSATAPLSISLAQQAENLFQAPVLEIYGFAEAGTVALRRPIKSEKWQVLDGISLIPEGDGFSAKAPYFPEAVSVPDRITVCGSSEFILHGRLANFVNIAGRRVSLDELNHRLNNIDGIEDGVFFMPDEVDDRVTRLVAFVVAPGKTPEEIQATLRNNIDPVFIPRPLYFVDKLPRNSTGKLPRESLRHLLVRLSDDHGVGKPTN